MAKTDPEGYQFIDPNGMYANSDSAFIGSLRDMGLNFSDPSEFSAALTNLLSQFGMSLNNSAVPSGVDEILSQSFVQDSGSGDLSGKCSVPVEGYGSEVPSLSSLPEATCRVMEPNPSYEPVGSYVDSDYTTKGKLEEGPPLGMPSLVPVSPELNSSGSTVDLSSHNVSAHSSCTSEVKSHVLPKEGILSNMLGMNVNHCAGNVRGNSNTVPVYKQCESEKQSDDEIEDDFNWEKLL